MELNIDHLKSLVAYDRLSGKFTWVRRVGTGFVGQEAGSIHRFGYRIICINKRRYRANRLAWFYVHGVWPENDVDHIDGNKLNDSIANLRDVTKSTNQENQKKAKRNNSSGLLGVSWNKDKKKWVAQIRAKGKLFFLGRFDDKNDAHSVYLTAKRELHQGCTI